MKDYIQPVTQASQTNNAIGKHSRIASPTIKEQVHQFWLHLWVACLLKVISPNNRADYGHPG